MVKKFKKARQQIEDAEAHKKTLDASHQQGEYNIWYHKYCGGDRYTQRLRVKAITRCNIKRDSGETRGSLSGRKEVPFCIHFGRGSCARGFECQFKHRLPNDDDQLNPAVDCFGRPRFASHREDMGGVGSFSTENHSLYIGSISANCTDIEESVKAHFSEWGEIEHINVLWSKCVAFVRYKNRHNAEFAREAMKDQSLDNDEILNVRWATEDPNPKVRQKFQQDAEESMHKAILTHRPEFGVMVGDPNQYFKEHAAKELEQQNISVDPKYGYAAAQDKENSLAYDQEYANWYYSQYPHMLQYAQMLYSQPSGTNASEETGSNERPENALKRTYQKEEEEISNPKSVKTTSITISENSG